MVSIPAISLKPCAEFNVNFVTAFSVIVREPEAAESMQKEDKESDEVKREMSDVLKDVLKEVLKEVSDRQAIILLLIKTNDLITIQEMSQKM